MLCASRALGELSVKAAAEGSPAVRPYQLSLVTPWLQLTARSLTVLGMHLCNVFSSEDGSWEKQLPAASQLEGLQVSLAWFEQNFSLGAMLIGHSVAEKGVSAAAGSDAASKAVDRHSQRKLSRARLGVLQQVLSALGSISSCREALLGYLHDTVAPAALKDHISSLGDQLQQLGLAACALLPYPYCCNNPECHHCLTATELQLVDYASECTGCRLVRYCGEDCQLKHWKKHKLVCKILGKQKKQAEQQGQGQ